MRLLFLPFTRRQTTVVFRNYGCLGALNDLVGVIISKLKALVGVFANKFNALAGVITNKPAIILLAYFNPFIRIPLLLPSGLNIG